MPDDKLLDLRFPIGGLDRSKAFARQPGLTAFDMLNVRPQSTIADRERGGRRPGVAEQYSLAGVLNTPVRLLNQVRYISRSGEASHGHTFADLGFWSAKTFDGYVRPQTTEGGTDGADYSNGDSFQLWPGDIYPHNDMAFVGNNFLFTQDDDSTIVYSSAMAHAPLEPFDESQPYTFTIRLIPQPPTSVEQQGGEQGFPPRWDAWYTLFLFMDESDPNVAQDGVALEFGLKFNHPLDGNNDPRNEYRTRWRQWVGGSLMASNSPGPDHSWHFIEDVLGVEFATLTITCTPETSGGPFEVRHTLDTIGNTTSASFITVAIGGGKKGFGMGLNYDGDRSGVPPFSQHDRGVYLNNFTINYKEHDGTSEDEGVNINKLVAGAAGRLWREDAEFNLMLPVPPPSDAVEISDGSQENNQQLMSVEYTGKLFIADSELVGTYTDGVINNVSTALPGSTELSEITTATLINWTTEGVRIDDHIVTITGRGTDNTLHRQDVAVYNILSIKDDPAGNPNAILELGTFPQPLSGNSPAARVVREAEIGANTSHVGITFRVERCGKVYDPATDLVTKWIQYDWAVALDGDETTFDFSWLSEVAYPGTADDGQTPQVVGDDDGPKGSIFAGAPIVATFLDRIWLAGYPENPNAIVASRKGDPYDWDFRSDGTDLSAAIGVGAGLAGKITQAITALIPVTDDYMLIATHGQLYRMLGDPSFGGTIDVVSLTVGVIDRFAWARGPQGETVFLSTDGLYILDPGAQSYPVRWSKKLMPRELININPRANAVSMGYDQQQEGFSIFITNKGDLTKEHWFVDYDTKGFFPEKRSYDSIDPWVTLEWLRDSGELKMITGSAGGFGTGQIHYYDDGLFTDLGIGGDPDAPGGVVPIENYVYFGPFILADAYYEGMISEIIAKFPESLPTAFPSTPPETRTMTYSVAVGDTAEQAVDRAVNGIFQETGLFGAKSNPKARVRVRGCYAVIKIESDGSPWAMETITAVTRKAGIHKVLN